MWEAVMRLQDLFELFLDDDDREYRSHDALVVSERRDTSSTDTSSLADIVRILRELDGQHGTDRET
jgi:hypothetical protein